MLSGPVIGAIADRWLAAGSTLAAASRRAVVAAVLFEIDRVAGPRPGWLDALYAFDDSLAPSPGDIRMLREVLHETLVAPRPAGEGIELQHRVGVMIDDLLVATTQRRFEQLEADALVDPLTGIANRRAGEDALARSFAHARRHDRRLAVAVVDLDGLKQINDTEGHLAGDEALQAVAQALRQGLRAGDSAYRFGGDEFVVLAPESSGAELLTAIERIGAGGPRFSIGVAELDADMADTSELIALADLRLYRGRRGASVVRGAHRRPLLAMPAALVIGVSASVLAELVRRLAGVDVVHGGGVVWRGLLLTAPLVIATAAAAAKWSDVGAAARRASALGTFAALALVASLLALGSGDAQGRSEIADTTRSRVAPPADEPRLARPPAPDATITAMPPATSAPSPSTTSLSPRASSQPAPELVTPTPSNVTVTGGPPASAPSMTTTTTTTTTAPSPTAGTEAEAAAAPDQPPGRRADRHGGGDRGQRGRPDDDRSGDRGSRDQAAKPARRA